MKLSLYDTTLRDGTQREGLSLSLEDKLRIAKLLDEFGVSHIEGGWPSSNPKDTEFFRRAKLKRSKLAAFGSTRKAGTTCRSDRNLRALLRTETPVVTIVGKSSKFHVRRVLRTQQSENLRMISESVRYLKKRGREVVYDAEHFFDALREDRAYALATIGAAADAGADWIVLCDTNGGSLPAGVTRGVGEVDFRPLGIHTHNDGELAVANALAAVDAGCTMVQGTINGYGERCGNANLVSVIPALQLKMGYRCVRNLSRLTELSRTVSEIANLSPDSHAPYVGVSAFAHKGGIHVAAVERAPSSYEHIEPKRVGNTRRIVVSELSGRVNVRMRAAELGVDVKGREREVLERIKSMENRGYQFEAAEGSFELLARRSRPGYKAPFEVLDAMVLAERRNGTAMISEASVKVRVNGKIQHTVAEGTGPVNALDRALRKALLPAHASLAGVRLADYKVRILDPESATGATTRVLVEASCAGDRWSTVGCSQNIIEASCQALSDSLELYLARKGSGR